MLQREIRSLRFALISLVMASIPTLVEAQRASPLEVFRACLHPAALSQVENERYLKDVNANWQAKLRHDPLLHRLCVTMAAPQDLRSWRSVKEEWEKGLNPGMLPSVARIQQLSDSVIIARQQWEVSKIRARLMDQIITLSNTAVLFDVGETQVRADGRDSAVVRQLADASRRFLDQYPDATVTFYGQADPQGQGEVNNDSIAMSRATSLMQAVIRRAGIDPTRVRAEGKAVSRLDIAASRSAGVETGPMQASEITDFALARSAGAGTRAGELPPSLLGTPQLIPTSTNDVSTTSGNWAVIISDVVIAQAKEQVNIYLMEQLSHEMCDSRSLDSLFPTACALFKTAGTYKVEMPSVRLAFTRDLSSAVAKVVRLDNATGLQQVAVNGAVSFGVRLVQGEAPEILIPSIVDSIARKLGGDTAKVLRHGAVVYSLIVQAREEIPAATANPEHALVQAALRAGAVNLMDGKYGDLRPDFASLTDRALPILSAVQAFEESGRALRNIPTTGGEESIRERRLHAAVDVIVRAFDIYTAVLPSRVTTGEPNPALIKTRALVNQAREMTASLTLGEYRNALLQGTQLALMASCDGIPAASTNCLTASPSRALLTFVVDFAGATDESTMRRTLQQYVGESGGYRMKREGDQHLRYMAINSYLGAGLGWEQPLASGGNDRVQGGAYLPVGVEFGVRRNAKDARWWFPLTWIPAKWSASRSLFLQVIDLGALAAARVGGEADVPEPRLTQVLSPGAFFCGQHRQVAVLSRYRRGLRPRRATSRHDLY